MKDVFETVANVAFVKVTDAKAAAASKKRSRDEAEGAAAAPAPAAFVAVNCSGKPAADVLAELTAANLAVGGKVCCHPWAGTRWLSVLLQDDVLFHFASAEA